MSFTRVKRGRPGATVETDTCVLYRNGAMGVPLKALAEIGSPGSVAVLIDKSTSRLAIAPCAADDPDGYAVTAMQSGYVARVRVGHALKSIGVDPPSKPGRYSLALEDGMLVADFGVAR